MGIPSTSRKGKKAWRKNITDEEVVEAVQQETHQQRRGPAVETLKDDELFFVDKGPDEQAAVQKKPKREKRLTRAQLILQAPQAIKPIVAHKHPKRKDQSLPAPKQLKAAEQSISAAAANRTALVPVSEQQQQQSQDQAGLDVWNDEDDVIGRPSDDPDETQNPARVPKVLKPVGPTSRAGARRSKPLPAPRIKAVEVDAAGCSYNPDFDSHQDALAVLVANENLKQLRKELRPAPIPATVHHDDGAEQDELANLLTEAEKDENEIAVEDGAITTASEQQPEQQLQIQQDGQPEDDEQQGSKKRELAKKTKKDRARAARAAAEAKAIAERKALKRQRALLQNLPSLVSEVDEEEAARAARRARREIVKEEKAAIQPPRLGKIRFEDLSVQVLTSDEVGQGLRRLKPFPMLATERFKSLQKRGLIEPRKPVGVRGPKRRVVYEKGARREKATEGQDNLNALRKANKVARKQL